MKYMYMYMGAFPGLGACPGHYGMYTDHAYAIIIWHMSKRFSVDDLHVHIAVWYTCQHFNSY